MALRASMQRRRCRRLRTMARGMSALGQKQTCAVQNGMSALPPKADMCGAQVDVRLVPIADIPQVIRANRKTASRRSLRNPIRCFDQAADACSLPLPAPAEQTQRAEAGGEEWECGGQRRLRESAGTEAGIAICTPPMPKLSE